MTNIKKDTKNEVVTKKTLTHFFEDLKGFIKSTVKGTENTLRKEIHEVKKELQKDLGLTQLAVTEHTKMIKENGAAILRVEQKVDKIAVSVESHEARLTVVEEKVEGHLAVHP